MASSIIRRKAATWDTLVNGIDITAASGNQSYYQNRVAKNYNLINVIWIQGGYVRTTDIMPLPQYIQRPTLMTYVDTANTQRWMQITHVNDGEFKIDHSDNSSGQLYIFGIY